MKTARLLYLLAPLALLAAPSGAQAATCSDYSNQAAAQRAKDTRDADHDGVYCEDLPCPCLRPGQRGGGGSPPSHGPAPRRRPRAQVISARITDVVDGDTIKVRAFAARRRFYTVRLLGIDTPETHKPGVPVECGGRNATANMLRLSFSAPRDSDGDGLLDREGGRGARVRLTTDPTQDLFDRFGRLLAYVTRRGGTNLEVAQLRAGWAKVFVFDRPFRQLRRFRAAQAGARRGDRGVWGRCGGDFHSEQ